MKQVIAVFSVALCILAFGNWAAAGNSGTVDERYPPKLVFKDISLDFELRRLLGGVSSGGGDVNEILYTALMIEPGNPNSWYEAWYGLGERIYAIGDACREKGHLASAREAFLRASMYYRSAEFYLHGNPEDPRIIDSWQKSRDSFRQGASLLEYPLEVVEIPYEGSTLPGYIMKPDDSDQPRKTLIVQTGFDGTAEELYFTRAFFALKRGYNVLIFEGPGQGGVVRTQHLFFRKDWEKVVTPVVDFVLSRPEFDPKKLVLMGVSMGGYLAPRAAAHEHRLAALVANGGVWDLALRPGKTEAEVTKEAEQMKKYPEETNEYIRKAMEKSISFRWSIENGMFTFGVKTPVEFLLAWGQYKMAGQAELIRCPTLIINPVDDHFLPGQPQMLYDALTCPKTLMNFTREDMASSHCQEGANLISNQRVLDWVDEVLSKKH